MTMGPIAFRFPRGEGVGCDLPQNPAPLDIGKGRIVQKGSQVAILSFGTRLGEVRIAAETLAAQGIVPTIADARFAKPLDREMILKLAADHEVLITIEEGAIGGFGSHVAQLLAEEAVFDRGSEISLHGSAGQFHRSRQPGGYVPRSQTVCAGYSRQSFANARHRLSQSPSLTPRIERFPISGGFAALPCSLDILSAPQALI